MQSLAESLCRKAVLNLIPMQAGDVSATFADISALRRDTGYSPLTPVWSDLLTGIVLLWCLRWMADAFPGFCRITYFQIGVPCPGSP